MWVDEISTARALLGLSVPIRGTQKPRLTRPDYELDEDIRATLTHDVADDVDMFVEDKIEVCKYLLVIVAGRRGSKSLTVILLHLCLFWHLWWVQKFCKVHYFLRTVSKEFFSLSQLIDLFIYLA